MWFKILLFFEKYFAFVVLHSLNLTLRYTISGLSKPYPKPAIYIFWHRNIIPLLINRRGEQVAVIISSSKDGDLIAEPAKAFGYIPVRGSSTRGGNSALREMIKLAKTHIIAITPDGPKGPAMEIKEGALQLAYLTKLPIYAVRVDVSRKWLFNSWDKFIFPKPFARISIIYSPPFYIKSKEDFLEKKKEMELWMRDYCSTD